MTFFKQIAVAALGCGILLGATEANATLVSYNDVFSGGVNGTLVTPATPLSWTHNINDSLNVATDTINTATLSIVLLDPQGGNEQVQISIDLTPYFDIANNVPNSGNATSYDTNLTNLQITSLLQTDGLLDVTLKVLQQGAGTPNVTFQSSTLSGIADTGARRVPEPTTLGLIGAGLVGLGTLRRRANSRLATNA